MHDDPLGLVGTTIGERYEVGACLGAFAPRAIYRAQHREWAQPVRLEVLAPVGDPTLAEQQRRAFVRAGGTIASLGSRHLAVPQARDGGIQQTARGPVAFVASEWVEGPTLADAVTSSGRTRFEAEQVVDWMEPVLEAMVAAHRDGVIHGHFDLHAFFVLGSLGPRAALKIDGLIEGAWRTQLPGGALPLRAPATGFAAPELASADTTMLGPWTDVFGLASVLSVLLCGSSSAEMRERGLPKGMRFAFDKALNPRIDARFKTLATFQASMMEGLESGGGPRVRNPRRTMVVADVQSELADGSAGGFEVADDDGEVDVPKPSVKTSRVRLAYTQPSISVPDALREMDTGRQRPVSGSHPPVAVPAPAKTSGGFVAVLLVLLVVALGGGVAVGYLLFQ